MYIRTKVILFLHVQYVHDVHVHVHNYIYHVRNIIIIMVVFSLSPAMVSIPPRMVQDQFGMMGLLTFIRGAETDPNLVALALGRYSMYMYFYIGSDQIDGY